MTKEEVRRRIEVAFAGEEMPRTERELAEPGIEARYVVEHFFGRSRSEIDGSTFLPSLHMEDFTYMTPRAVAYYLPPVLNLMLEERHDAELWIYLHGFLASARHAYGRSPRGLRREQHEAIADWAEVVAEAFVEGRFSSSLTGEPVRSRREARDATKLAQLYRTLAAGDPR